MIQSLNFQLSPTPELLDSIRDIVRTEIFSSQPPRSELPEYLTRKETAELLRISLVTLNEWSKNGSLQSLRINGRIRYKRNEVASALSEVKNLKYQKRGGLIK